MPAIIRMPAATTTSLVNFFFMHFILELPTRERQLAFLPCLVMAGGWAAERATWRSGTAPDMGQMHLPRRERVASSPIRASRDTKGG